MASTIVCLWLICTALVCVSAGPMHDRWNMQPYEQGSDFGGGFQMEALAIIAQQRPRPHPHPSRPPFFVGTFRSNPKRDWQINMYQVYNVTGFPASYVDEIMNITIVDLRNGTFRFIESAGNFTFYDLNFQLDTPIVVNGTNSSSDGEYTFRTRRSKLSVLSNTSIGVNVADVAFFPTGAVNVVYRVIGQNITGARHFRRVRCSNDPNCMPMALVTDPMDDLATDNNNAPPPEMNGRENQIMADDDTFFDDQADSEQ